MKKLKHKRSLIVLILILLVDIFLNFQFAGWKNFYAGTISGDAAGYYYYLPAFFYDNPAQLDSAQNNLDKYHFSPGFDFAMKAPNGNYIMKYSCGMAICNLPFFLFAHFYSSVFGYSVDGFSMPYQFLINAAGLCMVILGLWFLRKILLKFFSDSVTAITLFTIGIVSNYFQYSAISDMTQQTYLFSFYSIIIFLSIKWNENPSKSNSIYIGLLCGLSTLIRPTEFLTFFLPLFWGVSFQNGFKWNLKMLWQKRFYIFLIALSAIIVGSVQIIYWKTYSGQWLFYSYGEGQYFEWLKPHFHGVLVSYKKGWLVYTPVMIFALAGFWFLLKSEPKLFLGISIYFICFLYLVCSWNQWIYGGSWSMRAMIQCYPLLAFPLSSFYQFTLTRRWVFSIVVFLLIIFTYVNSVFMYQAYFTSQAVLDGEFMNAKYFWKIVGRPIVNEQDYKYIDSKDEIPNNLINQLRTIYSVNFKKPVSLDSMYQVTHLADIPLQKNGWYRINTFCYCPKKEWDIYVQPQLIITAKLNNEVVRKNYLRISRIIDEGRWMQVQLDFDATEKIIQNPFNHLVITLQNSGDQLAFYLQHLEIQYVSENE